MILDFGFAIFDFDPTAQARDTKQQSKI